MSNHSIRRATTADFDGVMAMGDVLFGIDYLQHRYHSFLADPNATSYVYLVGDEIVGFCSAFLVDDGITLVLRGSRVKDGFKGQGLYGKLTKHVYAEYRKVPSVKYEAFATNNKNYESKKEGLERSFTVLSRKAALNYAFNAKELNLPDLPSDKNTQEVTSQDMTAMLSSDETYPNLFTDGKIVITGVPLRLVPSNVKYIITDTTHALKTEIEGSEVSILSVGTALLYQTGVRYMLDIYVSDVTALRRHILEHLQYINTHKEGKIIFQIMPDPKMKAAVYKIGNDLKLPEIDLEMTEMVSFEKAF